MERGPTRASTRLERDLSRGHAAAAKGPWRREVAALVELVLEQVAAAEESALERVADTQDFCRGNLGSDAIQEGPLVVQQESAGVEGEAQCETPAEDAQPCELDSEPRVAK